MSSDRKRRFAIVAFLPCALFGIAMVLDVLLREQGDPDSPIAVVILAAVAVLLWVLGIGQAINHVSRRDDLSGEKRSRWNLAIVLFFPITLPMVWAKLMRPLPKRASERSAEGEVHTGASNATGVVDALAALMPRWYWTFTVIFGVAFAIFVAVIAHPLYAVIAVMGAIAGLVLRRARARIDARTSDSASAV